MWAVEWFGRPEGSKRSASPMTRVVGETFQEAFIHVTTIENIFGLVRLVLKGGFFDAVT